jgi:hypothetical protein
VLGPEEGLEDDLEMLDADDAARVHESLSPSEHAAALRAVRQLDEAASPPGSPSPVASLVWSER